MMLSASISFALLVAVVSASPAIIPQSGMNQIVLSGNNALVNTTSPLGVQKIPADALHFPTCSAAEANTVKDAFTAATAYAREAVTYLLAHPVDGTVDDRYKAWFGDKTAARYNKVLRLFQDIDDYFQGNRATPWSFYCHAENAGPEVRPIPALCDAVERDEFAKVRRSVLGVVSLCPQFWTAPATGTDSKAGTLVHEFSHFTVGGVDGTNADMIETYSVGSCLKLARDRPDEAIKNAENYEYFVELPAQCPLDPSDKWRCTVIGCSLSDSP